MILHALRLWNIKSYGDGADGRGVTVEFAPGINRIAGRNGHGKTTTMSAIVDLFNSTKKVHIITFG